MISTILTASDGSEASLAAERFAVALAARSGARLQGLSVVEERLVRGFREDGLGVAPPAGEPVAAYLKSRAEAVGRRLSEHARAQGVECRCESAQGIADDLIVERGQHTDLIVLGRDGQNRAYRTGLIGSTVNGVIHKTAKSALVVPPGAQLSGPIVLGFDGSPGSRLAAAMAVDLATNLSESVHVFVDSKDKGRAVARFDEVRGLVGSLPVPVREVSSTLGRPDVKLVDSAREVRAGLIVMGAFGRNRITEYFLGSNSAAVVRTSPIAVLVAR
ncbi:MAG: universal stress protein [Myxococcota bacterium]|nr:universal stress protein [bacterium]MDP6075520.1 universal stress protein [Myxococcota bacterium]MDP6243679.1 universal stress protein [Myxococcota bacterium]MDP7075968.1 universal stress protein [Myxococcota bacterium]MDP7300170.1 universal stress protein [Myxococcota bacterium]